jgi:hypothetical protein
MKGGQGGFGKYQYNEALAKVTFSGLPTSLRAASHLIFIANKIF